ncbi:long-chain-fatty-acid--CoA ligase [Actinomadura atramentaria]|uniref:long-chain-fatty-acid--CoA ligase n=1 Tax=Actinomadura atramentaria TaxID=1990 RepID=UPI00037A50B8|nr:long-chain fatty acid--CoA ligase [Actinomadura atramentaria]
MTALSLATVLATAARRSPAATALVEGDRRLDYAEVWRLARRVGGALAARGVGPGDRVALVAPNAVEFVTGYYGVLAAGATVVPVPTLLTAPEAARTVASASAAALLYHGTYRDLAAEAADVAGVPALAVADLTEDGPELAEAVARDASDTAVVFFTSGTTGRPKGVLLTHLNLVMNATVNAFDGDGLSPDDTVLGCLPLFHLFGQTVTMNTAFRAGATLVLQPRFDAAACLDLMAAEKATVFAGVPTMYVRLLEAAGATPARPPLRVCVSGGASLPVAVLERFEETFGTQILEGYGLSETTGAGTANQTRFGTRPGTVGHPQWGVEVEIADPDAEDRVVLLPPGAPGEIVMRGHNVFAGYLDDPAATAAALVDGWLRTGDIGTKDPDGFITVVDRKKDLIIRGGFNVYPREVEEVLTRHPAVAQAAVVGLPDPVSGEEVCAAVTLHPGATATEDEIRAYARERLARHTYPRIIRILDELPMGPSHKVLKRELREALK